MNRAQNWYVKATHELMKMKSIAWLSAIILSSAAGAQELWHTGKPADSYGVYFMVPIQMQSVGGRGIDVIQNGRRAGFDAPNMNVNTKAERVVGRIDTRSSDVVYKDLACHYYDSTYTVQAPSVTKIKNFRRRVESWVDFKGVVKRVKTYYEDERKIVQIDAIFEKETIEMDIVENGKPRHMSLNPAVSIESFNCPIPKMIENATKDRPEKLWCTIDPATGGIVQYTLRLKGRFVPPVGSSSKVKGWSFEVKGPVGIHTMHVSDDGQMRQIEYADTSVVRAILATTIGGG